ncbi:hypothetical protein Z043_115583 [Scleropages formosus]|uniref:CCHC-type domain-containing protein n=1 Tax=Scleropages formosus TaxID=113540 RepID=A0A0P7WWA0_SCLFO|nr:hypothetical protein Z043_115583 [Scleropages formosus]
MDLTQGNRLAADYAVEFRTLAESSGWGQTTLLACFWHGLNPRLQKELVFRGDNWTLGQFIETAITLDSLAWDREPRSRQVPDGQLRPREKVDSMQLGNGRLTTTEQLRQIQRRLCLCCGELGHLRVQCPIRPEPQLADLLWFVPSVQKLHQKQDERAIQFIQLERLYHERLLSNLTALQEKWGSIAETQGMDLLALETDCGMIKAEDAVPCSRGEVPPHTGSSPKQLMVTPTPALGGAEETQLLPAKHWTEGFIGDQLMDSCLQKQEEVRQVDREGGSRNKSSPTKNHTTNNNQCVGVGDVIDGQLAMQGPTMPSGTGDETVIADRDSSDHVTPVGVEPWEGHTEAHHEMDEDEEEEELEEQDLADDEVGEEVLECEPGEEKLGVGMEQAGVGLDSLDDLAKRIRVEEVTPADGLVSILKRRVTVEGDTAQEGATLRQTKRRRVRFREPDDGLDQGTSPPPTTPERYWSRFVMCTKGTACICVYLWCVKCFGNNFQKFCSYVDMIPCLLCCPSLALVFSDEAGGASCLILLLLCIVTVVISVGGTAVYCLFGDQESTICTDFSHNMHFYLGHMQRGVDELKHWFSASS